MFRRVFITTLLLLLLSGAALADESPASQITVTGIHTEPAVLMRGDTGTVAVEVTNTGRESVYINSAAIHSSNIHVLNENDYSTVGSLGTGNNVTFTFTIRAAAPDGIYYPEFVLQFRNGDSLRYHVPVKVENTPLTVHLLQKPDTYSEERKSTIVIGLANPRENAINGITIKPEGNGVLVTETGSFIGSLQPDEYKNVSFEITPARSSNLIFHVSYRNGMNTHSADLTVPVVIGEDKKRAVPVLNNIEVLRQEGHWKITGDVSNAGLEDAKSVVITTGPPAVPVDPFRSYVAGALEADDFAGFEVTCTANSSEVIPVIVMFRDADGNIFEKSFSVIQGQSSGTTAESGDWSPVMIGAVILLTAFVAVIFWYSWKKK